MWGKLRDSAIEYKYTILLNVIWIVAFVAGRMAEFKWSWLLILASSVIEMYVLHLIYRDSRKR